MEPDQGRRHWAAGRPSPRRRGRRRGGDARRARRRASTATPPRRSPGASGLSRRSSRIRRAHATATTSSTRLADWRLGWSARPRPAIRPRARTEPEHAARARDQHLLRGQALAAPGRLGADRPRTASASTSSSTRSTWSTSSRRLPGSPPGRRRAAPPPASAGLTVHSTFTGLAAYSSNLLLDPDPRRAPAARAGSARRSTSARRSAVAGTGGHVGAFSRRRLAERRDAGAERWAGLQADLRHPGAARPGAHGLARLPGREPGRGPRALHDGDVRDLLDRAATPRHVADPALPRRRPHVRARHRRARTATRTPGCATSGRAASRSSSSSPTPRATTTGRSPPSANARGRIDADRVIDALGRGRRRATLALDPRGECSRPGPRSWPAAGSPW